MSILGAVIPATGFCCALAGEQDQPPPTHVQQSKLPKPPPTTSLTPPVATSTPQTGAGLQATPCLQLAQLSTAHSLQTHFAPAEHGKPGRASSSVSPWSQNKANFSKGLSWHKAGGDVTPRETPDGHQKGAHT